MHGMKKLLIGKKEYSVRLTIYKLYIAIHNEFYSYTFYM